MDPRIDWWIQEVTKLTEAVNMKIMAYDDIISWREAFNMCSSNAKMITSCYVGGQLQEKEAHNFT